MEPHGPMRVEEPLSKGTLMATPNREPQEYSRNIIGIYLLHYIPTLCLGFPVLGSHESPFIINLKAGQESQLEVLKRGIRQAPQLYTILNTDSQADS